MMHSRQETLCHDECRNKEPTEVIQDIWKWHSAKFSAVSRFYVLWDLSDSRWALSISFLSSQPVALSRRAFANQKRFIGISEGFSFFLTKVIGLIVDPT